MLCDCFWMFLNVFWHALTVFDGESWFAHFSLLFCTCQILILFFHFYKKLYEHVWTILAKSFKYCHTLLNILKHVCISTCDHTWSYFNIALLTCSSSQPGCCSWCSLQERRRTLAGAYWSIAKLEKTALQRFLAAYMQCSMESAGSKLCLWSVSACFSNFIHCLFALWFERICMDLNWFEMVGFFLWIHLNALYFFFTCLLWVYIFLYSFFMFFILIFFLVFLMLLIWLIMAFYGFPFLKLHSRRFCFF